MVRYLQDISIAFWNVDGLFTNVDGQRYCKLNNPQFVKPLKKSDILCFVETHCGMSDYLHLDGYTIFQNRRPKSPRAPRAFGGIAVCIKNSIRKGIKYMETSCTEYQWIKLSKDFFDLNYDIFMCVVYVSPVNSPFSKQREDIFELIENDIAQYSERGKCVLIGDFNARTSHCADFIENDYSFLELPNIHDPDIPVKRSNLDQHKCDEHGTKLLNLCKASGLRIVNGRTVGDQLGYFTCYSSRGSPSVIDYALAHYTLLESINFFHVSDLTVHSIHCLLYVSIQTGPYFGDHDDSLKQLPLSYFWSDGDSTKFCDALLSNTVQNLIKSFMDSSFTNPSEDDVNRATLDINDIFHTAAKIANVKCKTKKKSKKIKLKNKSWYDNDCKHMYRQMKTLARQIRASPFDQTLVQEYRKYRRKYKNKLKAKKIAYRTNIIEKLTNIKENNTKQFWKIYDELTEKEIKNKGNPVSAAVWFEHFNKLMNECNHAELVEKETEFNNLIDSQKQKIFNELNFSVSEKEVSKAIKNLKNNKASGNDSIINEMLKSGHNVLLCPITKLFNLILISEIYPCGWRENLLTPIHKKGSLHITNNYRGIAVSSTMSKLFCSVLNYRLRTFIDQHNIIPNNQISYKNNARTCDHILTLKTIIDKYINKLSQKYLYTCFVDFKSAFDTIWRSALLYKLITHNIGGNFLGIIKDMYKKVVYSVKCGSGCTDKFSSSIGVKQGGVLSPLLFNLYLSDLPKIFDSSCNPVQLADLQINCLMYADDLVLLSLSSTGLQNCLDKLESYCKLWKLNVNITKTKVLIFNKGGRLLKNCIFHYGGFALEKVNQYCYLGITFTPSGNFKLAIETLKQKANKALFKLRKHKVNQNVALAFKLFNSLILPILNYGCEVWSPIMLKNISSNNFMQICDQTQFEGIHIKFLKYILGVHKNASNAAVRGELGAYPLIVTSICHSINYWVHLWKHDNKSLVYKCLLDISYSNSTNNWTHSIKKILYTFNMQQSWVNLGGNSKKRTAKQLKRYMQDKYRQDWLTYLNRPTVNEESGNKLRTYCQFKKLFKLENYLSYIKNPNMRKILTKLRISCHDLRIETGRHTKPHKTPIDQRTCMMCDSGAVEDEYHFITSCTLYVDKLKKLKEDLSFFPSLVNCKNDYLFQFIITGGFGDVEASTRICKFLEECFILRQEKSQ